ncbi:MAG: TIGR02679 family protein [Actinophytocola sp.]|nr:TIGR02679 family protein [Actinophytocola sp.]
MERGESLDTTVTLRGATAGQRAAVHRILGRPPRLGETLSVSLPAVDQVLRTSGACRDGLAAAVVTLTGDVVNRKVAAEERERAWQAAFAPINDVVGERPELAEWLAGVKRAGLVRRLAGTPEDAAPLLTDLAAVIENLPAGGEPVGEFAARVCRSAHALDDGQPLTTLALGAARALSGLREGSGAQWRRDVWASVGLVRDELSSTVLTLGLPGDSRTPTGRALTAWREAGEPTVLTLRHIRRNPPRMTLKRVFVCENPVVISTAADRLGSACAPVVCTGGQPGAAVVELLRLLADSGAQLYYHGDFDWGGLRIGNTVFGRFPSEPWRYRAADYGAVMDRGRELSGIEVAARWDADLAPAMREAGVAVEEEHVLDTLLADLA